MLSNILRLYAWSTRNIMLIIFFLFFTSSITGLLNDLDCFSRLTLNGFYLTNYYYFWTLSWWSAVILVYIFVRILLFTELVKTVIGVLVTNSVLIPLLLTTLSYWVFNGNITEFDDSTNFFNLLLINPLNQYHPNFFLLLIGLLTVLYHKLTIQVQVFKTKYILAWITNTTRYLVLFAVTGSYWTSFLGAWWAFQEGSWGGWWNWDLSEYFSLILFFTFTFIVHIPYTTRNILSLQLVLQVLLSITLLCNFVVQYNLTTTSHAFGQELNRGLLLNRQQLLILMGYTWLVLGAPSLTKLIFTLKSYNPLLKIEGYQTNTKGYSYSVWLYTLTLLLFYTSLRVLLKAITPTLTTSGHWNIFAYTFTWQLLLLSLLSIILLYIWFWDTNLYLTLLYYITNPYYLILILLRGISNCSYQRLIHLLVYNLIIYTLIYVHTTFIPQVITNLSLSYFNFPLNYILKVCETVTLESNLLHHTWLYIQGPHLNNNSILFTETTTKSKSTYIFNLPLSFSEQKLTLSTNYNLWFNYELEFVTPLMATLSIAVVLNLIWYIRLKY